MPDNESHPTQIGKNSRLRLILLCVGVFSLAFALILLARRRPPVYWAYSAILITPYTNAVLGRPFESQVIKSIPAVRKVEATPWFGNVAAAAAWYTNKAVTGTSAPVSAQIRIMVLGSSPQEARDAATNGAIQLRAIVERQFGVSASPESNADRTGRWLILYEMKLRVAKLLNINI